LLIIRVKIQRKKSHFKIKDFNQVSLESKPIGKTGRGEISHHPGAPQPTYAQAHLALGGARELQGQLDAAAAAYEAAVALQPPLAEAAFALARLLRRLHGRAAGAVAAYEQLLAHELPATLRGHALIEYSEALSGA
jgi:tetratricopeptide (TPR) repeat protein